MLTFRIRDCHAGRQHRWPRERSRCWMPGTAFATDFHQIPFGIRPKSVPAPRNQNMSQSLSQWSVCNLRIKVPVWPGTAATSEDADKAEDHGPCEMLCEVFARLPQGRDIGLKCGVAHPHPREPNSPPARQGHDTACFFARRTFLPQLRTTHERSSKHLNAKRTK
jgi:hypothetical protein